MNPAFNALLVLSLSFSAIYCDEIRSGAVNALSPDYKPVGTESGLKPVYDKARPAITISLTEVGQAKQPTDIQFVPGSVMTALVTEKNGFLKWLDLPGKKQGTILKLDVPSSSELGLLGIAFHPDFIKNGKIYLNYNTTKNGKYHTRISEWTLDKPRNISGARAAGERIILEVQQPYPNHNAGQLAFGPDGMLYIGLGDGGWRGDPKGHGQNTKTLLGAMLRVDVDHPAAGRGYSVPRDNPFASDKNYLPEIWAWGLRNPWRYSFTPDGRLVVADVGQDKWEEINIIEKGKNYGWNIMEGFHCYPPQSQCGKSGLADPVYEYGRDTGNSVTGGYVYTGARIPELKNKYVFGDFVSGRIIAIDLPAAGQKAKKAADLGKWNLLVSTFGRDNNGEIYLADFYKGVIYRIDPSK